MSYADKMAQELGELFEAEEERAAKEIERRRVRRPKQQTFVRDILIATW